MAHSEGLPRPPAPRRRSITNHKPHSAEVLWTSKESQGADLSHSARIYHIRWSIGVLECWSVGWMRTGRETVARALWRCKKRNSGAICVRRDTAASLRNPLPAQQLGLL